MIIDQWEERDPSRIEYNGIKDMMSNFRRPPSFSIPCRESHKRVYVVEFAHCVKIGITSNPRQRIRSLQKHGEIGMIFISPRGCKYHMHERTLQDTFEHRRARGEFFKVQYHVVMYYITNNMPFLLKE